MLGAAPTPSTPVPPLRWRAWPARDRPVALLGGAAAVAALSLLAGLVGGDLIWGLLALLLLSTWLATFLLPSRFDADHERVVAHGPLFTRSLRWREADLLAIDARGGWLGRSSRRAWRRQGLDLLRSPGDRESADALLALARRSAPATLRIRDLRTAPADAIAASPAQRERPA